MLEKNIEKIDESDLNSLIDNEVSEGKTIEYKQSLPGDSKEDKIKFLSGISSFANASGGDYLIGIVERKGIATEIKGVEIDDADKEKLRLEQIIRNGISPRIPSITIQPIKLLNKRIVFIIRIPQSWISPHRVIFSGHDKFYSRNSAGKYQLDVNELRTTFNLSETIKEKINNFRLDRISKISENETPIPLHENAKIILHLIPLMSFSSMQAYEIKKVISGHHLEKMRPIYLSIDNWRYNFDGLITFSYRERGVSYSYLQLFRNGLIETVDAKMLRQREEGLYIPSTAFERNIIEAFSRYLEVLKILDINPPIFIFLTLFGVKGFYMAISSRFHQFEIEERHIIDRNILFLPEFIIENYEVDASRALRPCFDALWNACGFERSLNYDENGEWNPKT